MRVNKLSQMSRTTETWTNNPRGKEITGYLCSERENNERTLCDIL